MKILILPGFAPNNEIWANETARQLGSDAMVYRWNHWDTGENPPDWQYREVEKIIAMLTEKTNILAKSIGTMIVMTLISKRPDLVDKLILCGIPVNDFNDGDETFYHPLEHFPPERLLVVQNTNDPHGSFVQAEELVHGFNEEFKVIETPRDDHEYPFVEEFVRFLT